MGLLTNLLPGLRDLRTPLTAGYAWFLAVWLLFGNSSAMQELGEKLADQFRPLAGSLTPTSATIGITSVAYLVGSLTVVDASNRTLISFLKLYRSGNQHKGSPRIDPYLNPRFHTADVIRLMRYYQRNVDLGPPEEVRPEETTSASEIFRRDREHNDRMDRANYLVGKFDPAGLAVRLHIANKDLWDQYDRCLAEAELRLTLALPSALLAVGVAFRGEWWAGALVALISVGLYRVGVLKSRAANGVLVNCLSTGVISDPDINIYD
jgi:hypothetical protein